MIDNHRAADEATRAAVREALAETFRSKTQSEWEDELGEADAMFAPVRTPREAVNDPQIRSRDVVADADGPMPRIGFPASARHGLDGSGDDVPAMGEHTAEVLEAAGIDEDAIDELRARDVV